MPRLTGNRLPKYRKHASGQAFITLDGREIYLGPHGTKASREEYDRVVGLWIANGRQLPGTADPFDLTINEIALRYLEFARAYYRKNGKETDTVSGIKTALRFLCRSRRHGAEKRQQQRGQSGGAAPEYRSHAAHLRLHRDRSRQG